MALAIAALCLSSAFQVYSQTPSVHPALPASVTPIQGNAYDIKIVWPALRPSTPASHPAQPAGVVRSVNLPKVFAVAPSKTESPKPAPLPHP